LKFQVVIPARGGSKRFPKKNLHFLNGIPLIAHSIIYALKCVASENIWVNTDDTEIAKVAKKYGVNITIRPEELGSDTTSTAEVLHYQQSFFDENNIECDAIILLQATNPLRPNNLLSVAINQFESSKRNSLASFTPLNKKFGRITADFYHPSNYTPGQRMQDIDAEYYEDGLIYITNRASILSKDVITSDVFPLISEGIESSIDIDEPEDILFAEFLMKTKK
jgi:N-acylneuraminate cytidylyltransferase